MMNSQKLNRDFWENKYLEKETQWDAGAITTPIKEYVDQLTSKELKILIPGAGNGYEAEYLWKKGFKNVFILDFAKEPLDNFKNRNPDFPNVQLIRDDFFNLEDSFDLIIEQTFFCAISPDLRKHYATQMDKLLKPNGKLVGLLFDFPLSEVGPPFGGDYQSYHSLFSTIFVVRKLERCFNSIKPRRNKEFFILLEKL